MKKVGLFGCLAILAGLTSCGASTATMTDQYLSAGKTETNMVFTSTYAEVLSLYSDETYSLEFVAGTFYRGATGDADNAWGNYAFTYYGSFTASEDEGVKTVNLAIPERITMVSAITISFPIVTQWDSKTDEKATINGVDVTTANMITEFNIKAQTISVDEAKYQFSYVDLDLGLLKLSQHMSNLGVSGSN